MRSKLRKRGRLKDTRMDAPLCREVFSPPLVRMWAGLLAPQLCFLLTSRLAEAWLAALAAALAAGWRVLARPANTLTGLGYLASMIAFHS